MRGYLLHHMVWVLSDATRRPHADAEAAAVEQVTFASSRATVLRAAGRTSKGFAQAVEGQPAAGAALPLGFFDKSSSAHDGITRPSQVIPGRSPPAPPGADSGLEADHGHLQKILFARFLQAPNRAPDIARAGEGREASPPFMPPT